MGFRKSLSVWASALVLGTAGLGVAAHTALAQAAAAPGEIKVATRRLTESQYRNAIEDIFGEGITINARFEPDQRVEGLLAIGASEMSITSSGFEQYFAMAQSIAAQALAEDRRAATVGCAPSDPAGADDACARAFIARVGERLFRRPLTPAEIDARAETANSGARTDGFYKGLELALASLLAAPEYLFRVETAEPDPAHPGQRRLDAYAKASRLSFLFWDAPPDAELLAAARSGALHSEAGLQAQIERLRASPRLEDGARAFFHDMLRFEYFDNLDKDPETYPKFSQAIADSAREQTLKTVIDQLVVRGGDYRDLFTSNETFLNRHLAAVYNVSYRSSDEWAPYTFPESSERAGILTQVSFLSLFSHPAASSPTKRGVKVHEIFFCEEIPDPPADVDFSAVQALESGTVRTRLIAHMENEGCASCHQVSDPPGLALEHFDSLGQLRTTENGQPIDVSTELDGKPLVGARGLARYLHDDERVPACLVRNVYSYGTGRFLGYDELDYLDAQTAAFAEAGYRFKDLLGIVASSPKFFEAVVPEGATARTVASIAPTSTGGLHEPSL